MSTNQPIEGVFFDLDGTLVNTAPDMIDLVNVIRNENGLKELSELAIACRVSDGAKALVMLALDKSEGDANLMQLREYFIIRYREKISDSNRETCAHLYPGMDALIKRIEHQQIPWGIVTNKPFDLACTLLKQLGILDSCQSLVCPEHVHRVKPDPESLLLACQEVGCTPKLALYIGDHQRDIEAGRLAGMRTMIAKYGYISDDNNTQDWGADYEISNSTKLVEWFNERSWCF